LGVKHVERIPLNALRSKAAYVILDAELALVSEHETEEEVRRALEELTLRSSRECVVFKRTPIGWFLN
jgi:hypothetical protein